MPSPDLRNGPGSCLAVDRLGFAARVCSDERVRNPSGMEITRNGPETARGPADWFTGEVFIDPIAAAPPLGAAVVHFTPGARTAWHAHPLGQTIWIMEGLGLCQREGGSIEVIRPGDRVFFEPGENHWHGAAPNRFMVHVAMQEADETGSPVSWGRHVSDEEYEVAPERPPGAALT